MKKTISTILALTMLITPIIGSTCFANEPKGNARESYVQEPERREQYRFHKSTESKVPRFAGCVAAGAVAAAGTTVAILKIFEDLLPGQVKEWLPSWLKKDNVQQIESNNPPANMEPDERAVFLDEVIYDKSVAPSIEELKQVEPHVNANDASLWGGTPSGAIDNNNAPNQHKPKLSEVRMPEFAAQTTAENSSVDYKYNFDQKEMNDTHMPQSSNYLLNENKRKSDYSKGEALGIAAMLTVGLITFVLAIWKVNTIVQNYYTLDSFISLHWK